MDIKKTILIVHTENASRRKHFETARKYGARLILIKRNPTWETQFVDVAYDVDTRSISKTVEAVIEIQKKEKIDGIVTFVEHSVPSAAAAAKALGLPFVSEHTAEIARNKYEMRKAFQSHHIPCPKFEITNNLIEAKKISKDFGYPVVLKPLIGGGSMYVRRINTETELEQHFDYIKKGAWDGFEYDPLYESSRNKYKESILIESYVEGSEVSVESLIINNKTNVLAIHDKPLPMTGPYFEELYFTTPSRLSKTIQTDLIDLSKKSHEALSINIGATHTEFRVTAEGKLVILESAARMGGGPVYRSVLTSTGIDLVHSIMELSLGTNPDLSKIQRNPTGFYLFFANKEGWISSIKGVSEVEKDPAVVEIEMYKKIGDRVDLPPKVFQAHGHMIVKANDLDALDRKVVELSSLIKIEV